MTKIFPQSPHFFCRALNIPQTDIIPKSTFSNLNDIKTYISLKIVYRFVDSSHNFLYKSKYYFLIIIASSSVCVFFIFNCKVSYNWDKDGKFIIMLYTIHLECTTISYSLHTTISKWRSFKIFDSKYLVNRRFYNIFSILIVNKMTSLFLLYLKGWPL